MSKTKTAKPPATDSIDDPVAAARAEAERLNSAELRFGLMYRERSAVLADLRASRGRKVYDADDPGAVVAEVNAGIRTLEDELQGYVDAAREARKARLPAIALVIKAECDAQLAQADAMEAEAAQLEAESDRLRAALEQHDDWGYVPAQGRIDGQYVGQVPHGDGQWRAVDARGPKFMRIRGDAQALKVAAAQGRFRTPHAAGSTEAENLESLVKQVYSDVMRLAPSTAEIIEWVTQSVEKERKRRSRTHSTEDAYVAFDMPMRLHLEWRNSTIDQAQSYIVQPEPPEVMAYAAGGEPKQQVRQADTDNTGRSIDEILAEPSSPSPYEAAMAGAESIQVDED